MDKTACAFAIAVALRAQSASREFHSVRNKIAFAIPSAKSTSFAHIRLFFESETASET